MSEIRITVAGPDERKLSIRRYDASGKPTVPVSLDDPDIVRDPYLLYRKLREAAPIFRCEELFGGAWVFMDHADIATLFRDADHLSNNKSRGIVDDLPEPERKRFERLVNLHSRWMVFFDAPKHSRLRKLMAKGFVPQVRERMAAFIHQQVACLTESFFGKEQIEVVQEYARNIPLVTVGKILGVCNEDLPRFSSWIDNIAAYMGSEKPKIEVITKAQQSLVELEDYYRLLIAERRKHPGPDDLLSQLIAAEEDGDVLSKEELLAQCSFLSFTGNETTKNLIANSIYCFLQHPEQKALLIENPSRAAQAIEETLRFECPVQFISRLVRHSFDYKSAKLKSGEYVILMIGAANRDPRLFADPDRLDIGRKDLRNISFGEGTHACLGQGLARVEAEIAVAAFFANFPNTSMAPHQPMEWNGNPGLRGLKYLHVNLN